MDKETSKSLQNLMLGKEGATYICHRANLDDKIRSVLGTLFPILFNQSEVANSELRVRPRRSDHSVRFSSFSSFPGSALFSLWTVKVRLPL